jgi:hypothetical protein
MSEIAPVAEAPLCITTRIPLKFKRRPGRKTILEDIEISGGNNPANAIDACINAPLAAGTSRSVLLGATIEFWRGEEWHWDLSTGEVDSDFN